MVSVDYNLLLSLLITSEIHILMINNIVDIDIIVVLRKPLETPLVHDEVQG